LKGSNRNGEVIEITRMRDLSEFFSLGPIKASICFKDEGETTVVVTEMGVKDTKKGSLENEEIKTKKEEALEYLLKMGAVRNLEETEKFLQNTEKVVLFNGTIFSTKNIRIRKL
jgi:hypothetical protein